MYYSLSFLLSYVALPPSPTRKKKKKMGKNSHVFFLLSSCKTVSDHFLFFLGCIVSPAQTRTERDLSLWASLTGVLLGVDVHPDLGQWRGEETFARARWCTWRALKSTGTAARTGGDVSAVLLGAGLTAGQLAQGAVGILWLWTFPVNPWWLLLSACVWRLHTVCQQILRLQMKRPHQSNERGNRSVAIHLTRCRSVTFHQISLLAWVEKSWNID